MESKVHSLTKQHHPILAYVQQLLEQQQQQQQQAVPAESAFATAAPSVLNNHKKQRTTNNEDNDNDVRQCLLSMQRQLASDTKMRALQSLLTIFHQLMCRAEGSYHEVRKEIRRMEETEIFMDASVLRVKREQFANLMTRERIRAKPLEDTMECIQYDIDHTEAQIFDAAATITPAAATTTLPPSERGG